MPSLDTIWVLVGTAAIALAGGMSFLAWNAPSLFARMALRVSAVSIGVLALSLTYSLTVVVTLSVVGSEVGPSIAPVIAKVDQLLALPAWFPWVLSACMGWPLVLTPIAKYRAEKSRDAK